jgi:hypothetical protein
MSKTNILELTTASVVSETEDYIPMVDVSDTTESGDGTTKKATVRKLLKDKALPSGDIVGTSDVQTLGGKTLTSPVITDIDITGGSATDIDITGGSISESTNVVEVLKKVYPVGCIYTSTVSTNPNTLFGFGTWSEYGQGRVLVGKSAEAEFDTAGKTGGAKTHKHRQGGPASDSSGSAGGSISGPWNDGTFGRSSSGVTFANYSQIVSSGIGSSKTVYPFLTESTSSLQPYIVVYFWKREN